MAASSTACSYTTSWDTTLRRALDQVAATGERWFEAELRRLAGEGLLLGGRSSEAARDFASARNVAIGRHAKLWELRAEIALSALGGIRRAAKGA